MSFFCIFCKKRKAEIVNIRIKLLPLTPISSLISKFIMKKLMMMVVAALMATVNANAQFEAGTFSLQPIVGCSSFVKLKAHRRDLKDGEVDSPRQSLTWQLGRCMQNALNLAMQGGLRRIGCRQIMCGRSAVPL